MFLTGETDPFETDGRRFLHVKHARLKDLKAHCAEERHGAFLNHVEEESGVWDKEWKPSDPDPEVLKLTNLIASRLEDAGEVVRIQSAQSIFHVDGWTLAAHREIPEFRNIVFLPVVGKRRRKKMKTALDYFLWRMDYENGSRPKGKHHRARMYVATSGKRVTVEGLRPAMSEMARRVSYAIRELRNEGWPIEGLFRNAELGDLVDEAGRPIRDANGRQTYHLHSHILINQTEFIPLELWGEGENPAPGTFLQRARFHLCPEGVAHWKEAGEIIDTDELTKYLVKPHNLQILDGEELAKLQQAVFRMHVCQPLGELRTMIKDLADSQLVICRPNAARKTFKIIQNPNSRLPSKDATPQELRDLPAEEPFDMEEWEDVGDFPDMADKALAEDAPPRILAWIPPAPIWSHELMPSLIVKCAPGLLPDFLAELAVSPAYLQLKEAMTRGRERNVDRSDPATVAARRAQFEPFARKGEQPCYGSQYVDKWSGEPPPLTSPEDPPPDPCRETLEAFEPTSPPLSP